MKREKEVLVYLMESQVTLDGVSGEEDFSIAGQDQQESIESLT